MKFQKQKFSPLGCDEPQSIFRQRQLVKSRRRRHFDEVLKVKGVEAFDGVIIL